MIYLVHIGRSVKKTGGAALTAGAVIPGQGPLVPLAAWWDQWSPTS